MVSIHLPPIMHYAFLVHIQNRELFMQYYFAPLEGLTDRIYRKLHHQFFPGLDRYYIPFLSPTSHRALTPKESKDLPAASSLGYYAIPQLLTKNADDFIWMAKQCADLGYPEVNLNLGCPSGTVTAKGKGSGMLRDLAALDCFLHDIYRQAPLPISIKTRIGFQSPEEFPALIEIFNRYPIAQLTVHPRVRASFYKGDADLNAFSQAVTASKAPLCYNGDLSSVADIARISSQFPSVNAVMLGRGLIGNPGMLQPDGTSSSTLERFHDTLFASYIESFGGARNAMFRMKEHWSYMLPHFEDNEKLGKRLRKCTDTVQFSEITHEIFHCLAWKA